MNKSDYEDAIRGEVDHWPGVAVEFVEGGKHPKARLTFTPDEENAEPVMLSRPYAGTPGDAFFGVHQMLGDMRRTMKKLGAVRARPEPSKDEDEAPYRKPNDGAAKRETIHAGEPADPKPSIADQLAAKGIAHSLPVAEANILAEFIDEELGDEEREAKLAEMLAAVDAIVDGIYFGLPDAIYHAVPRLSASGLQKLCISPATFWRGSWLDPERPDLDEEETKAQLLGKAYHCARLEPQRFPLAFVRKPSKADYPAKGLITSDDKVKAALKGLGQQQTFSGETIEERAQRLLDAGYEGTIFPLELARFEAARAGRVAIEAKYYDQIVTDMERVRANGEVAELLENGQAEVSIFFTDRHGLKMKCRVDYLVATHWDDFKTFDNSRGKELGQALADAVRYNRYHVQAATYRDGIEAIRTGGLQIIGEASDDQRALIASIQIRPKELGCFYIFQEKNGVPNLLARRFPFFGVDAYRDAEIESFSEDEDAADRARAALEAPTQLFSRAKWEIERAKQQFVIYSQVYKPGQPWFPIEPRGVFSDIDFSSHWLEGR